MKPDWKLTNKQRILLDFLLVFLFAAILIRPYFQMKYTDKWGSIESTFIADARFLAENWPHPQWQPLWYTGTRFDYIYPPALRYGTAALAKFAGFWPVKAYHFYVSFLYAIGIAGVYLLVRIASGSRRSAYLAAAATALTSPVFLFMEKYRHDAWRLAPHRLDVLVRWGEGPHISALALIPIALAFAWLAFEKHRPWAIALAAVVTAGVVSNNFYGATSLAMFYPVLAWSFWITRGEKRIWIPAVAIPLLSYGLTAFWLTPSYLQITTANMKYVSQSGSEWSVLLALVVAAGFVAVSTRLARGKAALTWEVFVAGSLLFFLLNTAGNYFFNFRIWGEPHRLVPELDLICVLAIVMGLRWMWRQSDRAYRGAALVVVVVGFGTSLGYVRHAWEFFPADPNYQNRVEYRLTDWLAKNLPDGRALSTGSLRFWYDAWHDLPQVGGGSEQGLENAAVQAAYANAVWGQNPQQTILWMQAMGADAICVSDKSSQDVYKDFVFPLKFAGLLPVLFDNRQGDVIYRVPRRYPARARVVDTARLNAAKTPRNPDDLEYLEAYADAIEKGPDAPVTLQREGSDAMRIHATLAAGQSLLVQESYDPAWQAWSGGKRLDIRKDAMGMMAIDAGLGEQDIRVVFATPLENQVGRIVTLLSALVALLLGLGFGGKWLARS